MTRPHSFQRLTISIVSQRLIKVNKGEGDRVRGKTWEAGQKENTCDDICPRIITEFLQKLWNSLASMFVLCSGGVHGTVDTD